MIILDGIKLSKKVLEHVAEEIKKKQLKLTLTLILVGNSLVSKSYINKKKESCKLVGIDFEFVNFSPDINEKKLKEEINKRVNDKNVSGIVIQLPLPKNFNTQEILNLIPYSKDADVLSENSFNKFSKNKLSIVPPVVGAVEYLLKEYKISMKGKKIALIGKGRLVGKPLSVWLTNNKADFFLFDKSTENISDFIRKSDIIISGVGSPSLIKKDMVKDGAVLIDVGNSSEEGKIKGDIESLAYEKASYVAPVPGGVGPVTVAVLVENLLKLYCDENDK